MLITEGERPRKPRWNFTKDSSIRGSRGELAFGLISEFLGVTTLVIVLFAPLYSSSSSTASSSSGGAVTVTHGHSSIWSNGIRPSRVAVFAGHCACLRRNRRRNGAPCAVAASVGELAALVRGGRCIHRIARRRHDHRTLPSSGCHTRPDRRARWCEISAVAPGRREPRPQLSSLAEPCSGTCGRRLARCLVSVRILTYSRAIREPLTLRAPSAARGCGAPALRRWRTTLRIRSSADIAPCTLTHSLVLFARSQRGHARKTPRHTHISYTTLRRST